MHKFVARMEKLKSDNLIGLGNHNLRKTKNHSNKEIDVSLSHKNYDLVNGSDDFSFKTDIEKYIDETKSKNVRSTQVRVNEWVISASPAMFEGLSESEVREYFQLNVDWFRERFGEDNVQYGIVHVDEKTPHMHLGVVPFDEDRVLSSKRVFNRQTLRDVQEELPKFLRANGFDIQRGEPSDGTRGKSIKEFKKDTLKDLVNDEILRNEAKQQIVDELLPVYKRSAKQDVQKSEKKRYDEAIANEKARLQEQYQTSLDGLKTSFNEKFNDEKEKLRKKYEERTETLNERFKTLRKHSEKIVQIHENLVLDIYNMSNTGPNSIRYDTQKNLIDRLSVVRTHKIQEREAIAAQQKERKQRSVKPQHSNRERDRDTGPER